MSCNFRDQIQSEEYLEENNKEYLKFLKEEFDAEAEKWNDRLMHPRDILLLEE